MSHLDDLELDPVELDELDDEQPETPGEARASSLIGKLRARRDDRLEQREVELAVPGWDGSEGYGLVVRYHAIRWSELGPLVHRQLNAKRNQQAREDLRTACDALIRACSDVRISLPNGAGTAPLDEAPDAAPCRFDVRTCELLELARPASARDALLAVYRDNDVAVVAAFGEYQQWLGETSTDETERALGEA